MKRKTLIKLQRKFLALPLHHIDTDIILEPENTENGRYCKRYLNKLGYKYRGVLSLPTLGEIFLNILSLKTPREKYVTLDIIDSLIILRKIEFYTPRNIGELLIKIRNLDSRIEPTDAEILACAIEASASALVTLDSKLIHNETLEKKFNIEIKHPCELP